MTHHIIQVDMECNADDFWCDLREHMPDVARKLERHDRIMVSHNVLMRLDSLGAFAGEPSPLIDCGPATLENKIS